MEYDKKQSVSKDRERMYDPIEPEKQIRLCTIAHGLWNDELSCTLRTRSLSPGLKYVCLSYVWGSRNHKIEITVGNVKHEVTRNLYEALRHLRAEGILDDIWIDALCVNQEDTFEVPNQVAMMGHIFRQAEEVLIWLGNGEVPPSLDEEEQAGAGATDDNIDVLTVLNFCNTWIVGCTFISYLVSANVGHLAVLRRKDPHQSR